MLFLEGLCSEVRIIESRLEKTNKIIKSKRQPTTTMPAKYRYS